MSLTVADHIAAFLRDRQVELAFGLCGHTNISLLAALERGGGPRFITTRHEQVAAHAADGYARASGKPGVVILHVGPGLTNAATGVATAALDSVPLVVIAGDIPTYFENRGPHQELNLLRDADQTSVFAPFVKRSWRLSRADQAPRVLARAWDLAQAGRPGPVLVSVPMDLLAEPLDAPIVPASAAPARPPSTRRSPRRSRASSSGQSGRSSSPAAGRAVPAPTSVAWPRRRRCRLATRSWGPVPCLPTIPSWSAWSDSGAVPSANRLASTADLILAVGTRFPETDSSSWEPGATFAIPPTRLIHIDIDPNEPGRNYPTDLAVVADAGAALSAIADQGPPAVRQGAAIRLARSSRRSVVASSTLARTMPAPSRFPMKPERILADLRRAAPDAILVTDVGWNKNGMAQQYPIDEPSSFLTPGGFSTMGFGPAAVLGVAAAGTERPAIALVGDGGFGAQPNVVATAVEMGIAPIWVVMNNASFGTIAGLERKHYGTGYGCEFEVRAGPTRRTSPRGHAHAGPKAGRSLRRTSCCRRCGVRSRSVVRCCSTFRWRTRRCRPGKWDIERIYQHTRGRVPAEV